ncbi:FMN-binding glutamate synthase family protein [Leptospira selangorensis]|uniref:FMN-binding glutamate synthase family protein n=1 Tax=Leptospira selangorensis TaxID=2484982 RepID=A0A4R9GF70_9LEPT|nr:FMN-binding glutamate synthase family protein [Leptospira selangorensis]TGK10650.1 FMN-binding glutamate synthase family protein [Leptospira selangorensis]TGM13507.1 FMN-binding glutamate synthase family protein [Leptospira selangorensis]TGM22152.1 FMN-binding glutamate synthase family protein [Leptospira selangorensis]
MSEELLIEYLNLIDEHAWLFWSGVVFLFLFCVFIHDIFQKKHTIKHNFPVVGHIRYLFEKIGPELRQYWVANDKEEMPFNRAERSWVYATAKMQNNNFGFGTTELLYDAGYPIIKHSAFPFSDSKAKFIEGDSSMIPSLKVMGEFRNRKKLYRPASVINISAMSYGSLGERAVSSLNKGAKIARCYHNTGEGGLSPYHNFGADVVWQLGTGYFGARDEKGKFSLDHFLKRLDANPNVRAIEIKLSQGAKPGKGGILPGAKVTKEIAEIRGIKPGQDCISPNAHTEFDDVKSLVDFIEKLASVSGLPIGIKSAVGESKFWEELASRMKETGQGPDFITIDGGEGGTGAAPLTFTDHVSLPFKVGFARVYKIFQKYEIADRVVWIGSGKLGFPDRAIVAFAMGCDLIHVARETMMSIGCIQAQKCHTGHCPAGVATQSKWLQAGLDVELKAKRAANYIKGFRKELLSVAHACGYEHPLQFTGNDIEIGAGQNRFRTLTEVLEYERTPIKFTTMMDYTSNITALG